VVCVSEIADEGYHCAWRDTPALLIAAGFEINHAGESLAICGPATAVSEKVICLSCTGTLAGVGEVVCAADQADIVGSIVLLCEIVVGIAGAFCCLRDDLAMVRGELSRKEMYFNDRKAGSIGFHFIPVDVTLPS
jgi:hypothetical protein